MIVVDSLVWIGQLRAQNSEAVAKLAEMASPTRIIVGDLVLMEVLRGARDERHADRLERSLRRFRVERMVDETSRPPVTPASCADGASQFASRSTC